MSAAKIDGHYIETSGVRPWSDSATDYRYRAVRRRPPKEEKPYKGQDTIEQINSCLNCKRKSCNGNCYIIDEQKATRTYARRSRPLPDDFRKFLETPGTSKKFLSEHYGVSGSTLNRWVRIIREEDAAAGKKPKFYIFPIKAEEE